MKIPKMIREFRKNNGYSMRHFQQKFKFDRGEVSRWENEKRQISMLSALKLAEALGIDQKTMIKIWIEDAREFEKRGHDKRKKKAQ